MNQRYFDLEHQWAQLRERIAAAASRSGRTASDLTAIAVTKTFPTTDVEHLIALGFRNFGENRVSERSEEHTSELQSRGHLVCRLLLEKKKIIDNMKKLDRLKKVNIWTRIKSRVVIKARRLEETGDNSMRDIVQIMSREKEVDIDTRSE